MTCEGGKMLTRDQSDHSNDPIQSTSSLNNSSSLPPRSVKHGKRKGEEQAADQNLISSHERNQSNNQQKSHVSEMNAEEATGDKTKSPRTFPFIQIVFWSLISIIVFFIGMWFYQEGDFHSFLKPASQEAVLMEQHQGLEEKQDTNMNENQDLDADKEENKDENKDETNGTETSIPSQTGAEGKNTENKTESNDDEVASSSDTESNNGSDPNIIAEHIVQSGETFYSITMKYYNSRKYMDALAEFNGITDIRDIKEGMKVKIPEVRY
jgi:hypothetical protein